jgi:hypothetical protein
MNALILITIAALALVQTFAIGFLALRAWTRLSQEMCWNFSGAAGCALIGMIALLVFLAGQTNAWLYLGGYTLIFAICATIAYRRSRLSLAPPPWLAQAWLFWILLLCAQLIVPIYGGAFMFGDWWMHYDIAQFYLGLRPLDTLYLGRYTIPSRTPLFNLFASFFLGSYNNSFAVYQVTAIIPGVALLGTVVPLLDKRALRLGLALVIFNPFLVTMSLYPWPKVLTATCILTSLYYFTRWDMAHDRRDWRSLIGWGVWTGFAIFTHSSAVFYALGALVVYVWHRRHRPFAAIARGTIAFAVACSALAPWLLWVWSTYGIATLWNSSPTAVAQTAALLSNEWWVDRIRNLSGTMLPIVFALAPSMERMQLLDVVLRFYYGVLPGACTIVILNVCWRWLRQSDRPRLPVPFGIFASVAATGLAGGVLLQPGANSMGLVAESMAPIVLIVLIVAASMLNATPSRVQRMTLIALACEFVLIRGVHTMTAALFMTPSADPNWDLKAQHSLTFARDTLGSAWIAAAVMLLIAFLLLVLISLPARTNQRYAHNEALASQS